MDAAILIQSHVRGHQTRSTQAPAKDALNVRWQVEYTEERIPTTGGSTVNSNTPWLPGTAVVYHASEDKITVMVGEQTTHVPASDPLRLRLIEVLEDNSAPSQEAFQSLQQQRSEAEEAEEDRQHGQTARGALQEAQIHAEAEQQRATADVREEFPELRTESAQQLVALNEHLVNADESCCAWFRRTLGDKYSSNIEAADAMIAEFHEIYADGGEQELLAAMERQRAFAPVANWQTQLAHLGTELVTQLQELSLKLPKDGREKLRMLMENKTKEEGQRIVTMMESMDASKLSELIGGNVNAATDGLKDPTPNESEKSPAISDSDAAVKIQSISRGRADRAKFQEKKKTAQT